MPAAPELVLEAEPDAPTRARRYTTEALVGALEDTVSTAELVVTELVTNAVLHARAPIVVRIARTETGARIEVEDGGRDLPIAPPLNPHSMTGRGLALVSATAAAWGVEPTHGGRKTVWAEISDGPPGSATASLTELDLTHLEQPGQQPHDEPVFTVRLGSVPTDLLLAAKSHVDNVLREFHLVTSGAGTSESPPPPELARLIETMAEEFALARTEIKRQAVATAERGDTETELVLTLPISAAAAGERYLAALDKVDAYARSAALLTLESAPAHRVFRQWYVQGLIDQLRALAAGGPQPVVSSFPQALAAEVTRLSSLRDDANRLSRLQQITSEMAQARTVSDLAGALTSSAARHLDALSARVHLVHGDELRPVSRDGAVEPWAGGDQPMPLDADLPAAEVTRTRKPLAVRGRAALSVLYPATARTFPDDRALHCAPLIVGAECIGALSLTFPIVGLDEESRTGIVTTLADTLAQALERAISTERAAEANAKLAAAYREKAGQLADVRRVADAAQRAILAPPPAMIGPVALAARYVGAAAEAQVGGDLYEVIAWRGAVRLLIGDVRGKGLSAVRMATIVLGEFRAVAADLPDLPAIAGQLDRRLRPHLGEEDFVTALLAEIHDDGTFSVASCGHPPALILTEDQIDEVGTEFSLPLGLGAAPIAETGTLQRGDRLLLYTDGAIETRDADHRFLDFVELLRPTLGRDHVSVLDEVLTSLRQRAGGSRLNDDLALLIAEYRG